MPRRRPLPDALLADMLGRLATALAAGIDLRRAWASETARTPARLRPVMEAVSAALAGGAGLGAALAAAGAAFPPFVRGMVAVGDETGHEPETLRSVSETLRAQLLGLIQTPATRIAGILQAPGGQVARVLSAYAK